MPEATLKAIEQLLDKKLEPIESTVAKTAALVANLVVDVPEIKTDLKAVRNTVDRHTASLDAIAKDVKDWNQEMTLMRSGLSCSRPPHCSRHPPVSRPRQGGPEGDRPGGGRSH